MSILVEPLPTARPAVLPGARLAAGMVALAVVAAVLAGWVPIQFSIATVFLFAGPHNWLEARYILGRLPARAGRLFPFFAFSFVGIVGLTAGFAALPYVIRLGEGTAEDYLTAVAGWNSLFLLWIATLVHMRSRTNPRREWGWVWPVCFMLMAGAWLAPYAFSLVLVYAHPLMALWILDRELAKTRPDWRPAYHACLLAVPALAGALVWRLHDAAPIAGDDELTFAITNHAGRFALPGVSDRLLVALHTFLEMVHYGVWVLALPLIGMRSRPWALHTIPAARRSARWQRGVALFLLAGLAVVVVLWTSFVVDYPTTRHVYFVVAMLHVLAEIPFLLRLL